ncbi:helix-turn-helix domain-containing protein [Kingella potus]|uniref:helix-turn-helix domain-containing protein n=1 Tax=Kingella potus TaxID=265175 RepID=UPI001FD40EBD|nr:helix-turn-helix domain-containing protein [Kingella potus]UOP00125.1 helix-turn-helix domain-containing protein [Kingella potus]
MSEHTENQVSENPAGEFGRLLRTQRERRGLSIGEVAERLKLSAKQIEAFEAGNYESMPESVFVRGFLRTYGRFLELDDELVSSYLDRIMPGSAVRSRAAEADRQGTLNFQNQKTGRQFPTWIFGLLVIIAIGAGVYAWQGKSREENSKQTTASEAGAVWSRWQHRISIPPMFPSYRCRLQRLLLLKLRKQLIPARRRANCC